MENKFELKFEDAINCANVYLDEMQDVMNMIKEQKQNEEELEVVLLEIANDEESHRKMVDAADKYLKEEMYQAYLNQRIMNELYRRLVNEVLPGDNFEPLVEYLESLTEEEIINKITSEIEAHESRFKYDTFSVLGYRSEYYHDNDCNKDYLNERIVLVIKHAVYDNFIYELKFSVEDEDLSYVLNTYGHTTIERVTKPIYTAKIKEPLNILLPKEINGRELDSITVNHYPICLFDENDYFEIPGIVKASGEGGDEWYPSGYVEFNKEAFEEPNKRQMYKKPVWIFKGDSGAGKTYLSTMLERMDMKVFETDSIKGNEITDPIKADIIVIGNKHGFKVDYVKEHVANRDDIEFIEVDFNK